MPLRRIKSGPHFPHFGAFESTNIKGSGQDVLGTTGHIKHWRADLERLQYSNIRDLRYPIPWHRIERTPGTFDWSWTDGPLEQIRTSGMQPILDLLHHVSFPDWLEDGFANPQFPELYLRFVGEVAKRYDWVDRYTLVNEPLPTLVLCALTGDWYPHRRSELDFVTMGKTVARALCMAASALRKLNTFASFYHIDSCEHHSALDTEVQGWVKHANRRRFLFHDLILGQVDKTHPLLPYLQKYGFTEEDRHWFRDHATQIDVLGLDYYAHSEIEWKWHNGSAAIQFPCRHPLGFAAVAQQYVERFRVPVMLSETNIGGSVRDRVTWLKFMEAEAERLAETADVRGFCWFPSIDATDWDSLCTVANKRVSPMGIWSLERDCETRSDSELSEWYVRLARGECNSSDLPAYQWDPPLDDHLAGYVRLMERRAEWRPAKHPEFELVPMLG